MKRIDAFDVCMILVQLFNNIHMKSHTNFTRLMITGFKNLLFCSLFLSSSTKLFSQDTVKLRQERLETLKHALNKLHKNANKLIENYKNGNYISPEIYKDLKEKIDQFDKSLKARTAPDQFYIRRLGDTYEDITQQIISVNDSVSPTSKMPKTKRVTKKFFDSYSKTENAISRYDDLNWNNSNLLFKIYANPYPTPI
ncbi:hypothetical protein [Niastella populi]|uniref:Uncharacterized protein n=1 Tax=Niastella populi TaxID=550983 RepID=A0A1V9F258_9BACT|nr:hypothetical protein [Niastella populi]OQP52503.1 hypothetical protein A4R26_28810 [Niastella populi]